MHTEESEDPQPFSASSPDWLAYLSEPNPLCRWFEKVTSGS